MRLRKQTERELLIHHLDQLYCRCETLYYFTLNPGYLLNGDPREVLADLKTRLPEVKKLLDKKRKTLPRNIVLK